MSIIGIVSIKGGVGKTTTVANIGAILAKEYGKRVLVVDANLDVPNLGMHFGYIETRYTLHDVLDDSIDVRRAIRAHEKSNVHILPASLSERKTDYRKLKSKIMPLKEEYDFILIDTMPEWSEKMISVIDTCDKLILVTCPDFPTISTTIKAIKLVDKLDSKIIGITLNRASGKKYEVDRSGIENATGYPILGTIPHDEVIPMSIFAKIPAVIYAPEAPASYGFRRLAAYIAGAPVKMNKSFLKRLLDRSLF